MYTTSFAGLPHFFIPGGTGLLLFQFQLHGTLYVPTIFPALIIYVTCDRHYFFLLNAPQHLIPVHGGKKHLQCGRLQRGNKITFIFVRVPNSRCCTFSRESRKKFTFIYIPFRGKCQGGKKIKSIFFQVDKRCNMVYYWLISMKVYIADEAGFCFGVKKALNLIARLHEKKYNIQIYGQLIHNQSVLKNLQEKGIGYTDTLAGLDRGKKLVIRTHGIPRQTEEKLRKEKIDIVDATCPFVKKIHRIIEKIEAHPAPTGSGRHCIVIVGDRDHPEVTAAAGYARQPVVINSSKEAEKLEAAEKIHVIAQTTLNSDFFEEIIAILRKKAGKLEVYNTICSATKARQEAIRRLAPQVDFVVVVGGKNSSNTRKLFEIALEKNKNTFFIESSRELYSPGFIEKVSRFSSVGITAGASTPPQEIEKVKEYLIKIENIAKEIKNGRTKRSFQH